MPLRKIELARAAWGGVMLFAPLLLARFHHVKVDTTSVAVARILGARHLSQAALSGINPSPEILAMGVWVDTAHAATALALAVADRSRARAGLTDTVMAGTWAGVGYRDLRNAPATPPAHDRRRDTLARLVLAHVPGGAPLLHMSNRDRRAAHRSGN